MYAQHPLREGTLYARFLGGFALLWNGKSLTSASKSSETQFSYLMQMLLHYRKEGVSRGRLEEFLFADRDVENVHHALQSVVYNAKRRLRSMGLPEANYIVQSGGVFRWTEEISVESDTEVFARLVQEAGGEEDPDKRLALWLSACGHYRGEFLPNQVAAIWAAQTARRYRQSFCGCVERAAKRLRDREDFETMEQLGLYAARVDPLADWETVTMDALVSRGMYREARQLYDDTVQLYLRREGLRPSKRLVEIFRRLGAQMKHRHKVLDAVQEELNEPDGGSRGGYCCTYPVFRGIYRAVVRLMERGGQSVYLMMCTLMDGETPMEEGPALEALSAQLEDVIGQALRRTDVLTRYGAGQFLVLLVNITLEDCKIVQRRIDRLFAGRDQRVRIQYYDKSVLSGSEAREGADSADGKESAR